MMRTARDYRAGIATETGWNTAPTAFRDIRLLAEDLHLVGVREGRRALSEGGLVAPTRLVRTHIEGGMTLTADAARLSHMMTFVTGGAWTRHGLPEGVLRQLAADGADDPRSMGFVRRLAPHDDWQQFSGLRLRGLRIVPAGDSGIVLMLDLVGAEVAARRRVGVSASPAPRPPVTLRPAPDGLVIRPVGAAVETGPLMLTGFEIGLYRDGMRPHFALAANSPQMILPGQLAARIEMRLLASDAAKRATEADRLSVRFGFADESARFEMFFPLLTVIDRREHVDADGGPAVIRLRTHAEPREGGLFRLREISPS